MAATLLPVTLVTAGGAALINIWLAVRVGQMRRSHKVFVGDAGNEAVIRRMRAQANFVEYVPFVLILMGLVEFTSGTSWWLWLGGAALLVGRIFHAFGMDGLRAGRSIGTAITFLLLIGLGVYAIALAVVTPVPTHAVKYDLPIASG